ncbi:hypothetical protein BS47DRAFT_1378470 [Hydnum rufescens UP504]|uniref:Uncharacterized protein n=1 Tax=Hydnum rufescens UP504 TaxID=1448309 RepID=A0A9P6E0U7_9AGAM|nr:hypothetical protein BS47DRAFT_1378470 [Hydnum rufescens UP504]
MDGGLGDQGYLLPVIPRAGLINVARPQPHSQIPQLRLKYPRKDAIYSPMVTSATQFVSLRIAQVHILPITDAATDLPGGPSTGGHLYLIEGTGPFVDVPAIRQYAGTTVDLLISSVTLAVDVDCTHTWATHLSGITQTEHPPVARGNLLHPGIYEFVPTNPILLSRISTTSVDSKPYAVTFHAAVTQRNDGTCVMSGNLDTLTATHLIPKRMGLDGARDVVTRFCREPTDLGIYRFDPGSFCLLAWICVWNTFIDDSDHDSDESWSDNGGEGTVVSLISL